MGYNFKIETYTGTYNFPNASASYLEFNVSSYNNDFADTMIYKERTSGNGAVIFISANSALDREITASGIVTYNEKKDLEHARNAQRTPANGLTFKITDWDSRTFQVLIKNIDTEHLRGPNNKYKVIITFECLDSSV